ncbi:MAG: hypothetical protein R3230_01565 [Nitrosopumilaceae archaeon]|nr:hypothetical protein [Nitrosopumilaceae archaeon]
MYQLPQHILNIQSLNLTRAGSLLLLGYYPAGIQFADKQIQRYRDKQPLFPFKLFTRFCFEATGWDHEHLSLIAQIFAQEKIPPESPPLTNNKINLIPTHFHHVDAFNKKAQEFLDILNQTPAELPPPEPEDPLEAIDPQLIAKYYKEQNS